MKKIFTFIAALALSVGAFATDYTDSLVVTVNGVSSGQKATISLEQNSDGTYNFSLKNFILNASGQLMPIGNINLDNVEGTTVDGVTTLNVDRDITIANGDQAGVTYWMGSMLGTVPVRMIAELRGSKLYTVINIYMKDLKQDIKVVFGDGGYQMAGSGFEDFYTYANHNNIAEPLHWHSFASAGGDLAGFVSNTAHTFVSNDVRPGSTGTHSVSVKATSIFGIIANGTITTGRMNAGSAQAANTANHAELDMSKTDKDGNGDPFYMELNGRPDSLAVWVKFSQGTANSSHPYATVSAIITDGTYYQDPEDKSYSNKLAEAKNTNIATTGGEWKRISIPFKYIDRSINGKAILVTISTNADAGQGSNNDEILVDDISLIYNAPKATAISVNGDALTFKAVGDTVTLGKSYENVSAESIVVTADKDNAKIFKTVEEVNDTVTAVVKVASNDLQSVSNYKFIFPAGTTTGINAIETVGASNDSTEIYNLSGQRVNTMQSGHVYVVKKGGKAVKVAR